jgi:putative resolvase
VVLAALGQRLVVADLAETEDDLVPDMVEVFTSFCARLYPRRSAPSPAKKAIEAIRR